MRNQRPRKYISEGRLDTQQKHNSPALFPQLDRGLLPTQHSHASEFASHPGEWSLDLCSAWHRVSIWSN